MTKPTNTTTTRTTRTAAVAAVALIAGLNAAGCERDAVWESELDQAIALGLDRAAAIVDPQAERVLLLAPKADLTLEQQGFEINDGFATASATPNGARLLVLSHGVVPRQRATDPGPRLETFMANPAPARGYAYALADPLSGIAVDPLSRYAVLHPKGETTFLQNPNELAVVDLTRGAGETNPTYVTLRSFGGTPQSFTFTDTLSLPGGERRLLVVQTDRDVALVDFSALTLPDITIPLSGGSSTLVPGGVAVSDGSPDSDDDARIAIRVQGEANVIVVDLKAPLPDTVEQTPQSFQAIPNVVYVNGVPRDIAFVNTDGGLRLAALLGSTLTLVDPATGVATEIVLGSTSFEHMSIVTDVVGAGVDGSDVAMLWSSESAKIGFLAFGSTVGKPYKSVELLSLPSPVRRVDDVAGANPHLRILSSTTSNNLFVLDLLTRTAAPLVATQTDTQVLTSRDGLRGWLSQGRALARLDLGSVHPQNLLLSRNITRVFDLQRSNGNPAVLALHTHGAFAHGATVLDANNPTLAGAVEYAGLLLGELK